MAIQYTKDKTNRLSFRVNESLYDWVQKKAKKLGISPCDYARSVLFQQQSVELTLSEVSRCSDCEVTNENGKKHK